MSPLAHVLLALAAVILLGRSLALVLRRIGQPAVIGEVLAGIALGPSLLGAVTGWWLGQPLEIVPASAQPHLAIIAELGIVLYMFLIGVEFNTENFRKLAKSAIVISVASLLVPFSLGLVLAAGLYADLAPAGVSRLSFGLFFAVSLAVTAFPILSRILTDRGIAKTELGLLALSCAAVGDVAAWWLLALVAGVVRSEAADAVPIIGLSVLYIGVMLLVVRPLAVRLIARFDGQKLSPLAAALIFASLLLSAMLTDWIGIHAVFGAFLLGVVIPHDSRIAEALQSNLEQVVLVLLLPAFFAYTGLRTQIGLVSGWQQWAVCGAIVLVATLGKFGGTLAAARLTGLDWRTSSALGVLMNTRGLMELIVLNIGLDLGVISPTLFAMLVLMALATTLATSPLLSLLERRSAVACALAPAK